MSAIKATTTVKVDLSITLSLTEGEARALDALAGYGDKSFLDVFYRHLGKSYLEPYEADLKALFDKIRAELPPALNRAEKARTAAHFVLKPAAPSSPSSEVKPS